MADHLNHAEQELFGEALAVYHYTGWWRSTHDIDVYVTRDAVEGARRALDTAGFADLGEQAAGDREWIYHAGKGAIIVDVIWRFANLANVDLGRKLKVKVMLENMPHFSRVSQLKPILDAVPGAELLLDVGHANLDTPYNRSEELVANFGSRLSHVHVSDNRGGQDDTHLPLGVGNINWLKIVRLLKNAGYDGTVTVEVFGDDTDYLVMSREKFRMMWDETSPGESL